MEFITPIIVIVGLVALAIVPLAIANRRWPEQPGELIAALDACLPQTQCGQCGFPGCRPYARALAEGNTSIDLCPPGGRATYEALARLLPDQLNPPPAEETLRIAIIDEQRCIGCALCLPACPVDAIVGAPRYMHSVILAECTGCGLCLPPCPVDCIEMQPLVAPP